MRSQTPCLNPGEVDIEPSHSITSRAWGLKDSPRTTLMQFEKLTKWNDGVKNGNYITAIIQQIIYECPMRWFGCRWFDWYGIAMISKWQYYEARRQLLDAGKIRVERINIPRQRQYVLCHTLDMDAEPPEPGVNLYIWGKD